MGDERPLVFPVGWQRVVFNQALGEGGSGMQLYKDSRYSVWHIIEDIKHGKTALPDIQRPFVWSTAKIRDLFDSMYRGYPIGTLMFWETGASASARQIGGGNSSRVAQLLVVDGQQRLTSLFAVMTGEEILAKDFTRRRIRIAFDPFSESFEVADAAIQRDPTYIPDITMLWQDSYKAEIRGFFERLSRAGEEPVADEVRDRLEERIDRVRDLRDFSFQVIELAAGADEEQVAEIFVRINSEGVQLNQADFILTLMSVYWEDGRRALEGFARACVDSEVTGPSPKNDFLDPSPDQMLRAAVGLAFRRGRLQNVYSLLRGKDLDSGELSEERRESQFRTLESAQKHVLDLTNWHEFLKCLQHAGFRNHKMISSSNAIIYTYTMWLVGRRDFKLSFKALRPVIARWFFMAHTTGRYTSSPESAIESDLNRISRLEDGDEAAFCRELDRIVRSNFTGDYWQISLPNALDSSAARSPVLFAYWAALNIIDAELLFSNVRVKDLIDQGAAPKKGIERHHLFPKAHLRANGVTAQVSINSIANMAFIDWPENLEIGASDPKDYWPQMTAGMSKDQIERQSYQHALPVGWDQLSYETFLERRRLRISQVVKDGFEQLWESAKEKSVNLSLEDLLEMGESQTLEFKSSARWNIRGAVVDRKMEHVVLKTVAGFLNADGGQLLIGVDDSGTVVGLDADMATLSKPNRDGLELWLRQHLDANLSVDTSHLVRISIEEKAEGDVALVSVSRSGKPIFTKPISGSDPTEFWVRVGNQTKQMHGEAMTEYVDAHWS